MKKYNVTKVMDKTVRNDRYFSPEARKKISETMSKRVWTKESLKKLSDSHNGYIMPEAQKQKIREAHLKRVESGLCRLYKDGRTKIPGYLSWINNKRNRVLHRIKKETGTHTYGEWELLKKQYNYTCPCCKKAGPEIKLTEDHIIPLSRGGSDLIENIQPLCLSCNSKKHSTTIKYDI